MKVGFAGDQGEDKDKDEPQPLHAGAGFSLCSKIKGKRNSESERRKMVSELSVSAVRNVSREAFFAEATQARGAKTRRGGEGREEDRS